MFKRQVPIRHQFVSGPCARTCFGDGNRSGKPWNRGTEGVILAGAIEELPTVAAVRDIRPSESVTVPPSGAIAHPAAKFGAPTRTISSRGCGLLPLRGQAAPVIAGNGKEPCRQRMAGVGMRRFGPMHPEP